MFQPKFVLAGIALALTLVACTASSEKQASPVSPQAQNQLLGAQGACPLKSECPAHDATVATTITDTPGGVAVEFVTQGTDRIGPLRSAVQKMAARPCGSGNGSCRGPGKGSGRCVGESAAGCPGPCNTSGGRRACDNSRGTVKACTPLPAAHKAFESIDGGARLSFAPADGAVTLAFRSAVRGHFEGMKNGGCGMKNGPCATKNGSCPMKK